MYRPIVRQLYLLPSLHSKTTAAYNLARRDFADTPVRNSTSPLPRLMNFPEIIWPSFYKTIRNWCLVAFVVRPYFDNDFYMKDFIEGAKHAIQVVSKKISNGENGQELKGLVADEAIEELKQTTRSLSVMQRQQIAINKDDIFLIFPYEVGIIFGEESITPQRRWLEITTVCHVLHGFNEMQERGEQISFNFGNRNEYQDQIYVCNYRFIKEFTKGVQSDWIINIANHFRPVDLIREGQQQKN